jgi:hypothetical protein
VADTGVPAYTLDPAFVRGHGGGRVAVLEYVAVVARAQDGRTATIQAAPDAQAGWRVGSVLSGDDETRLATGLRPGAVLLDEPQINGWYELSAAGVRLLRASLPQTPVGEFVPLASYQRQVHDRYADKQPGSQYQRDGGLGFAQHPEPAAPGTPGWWWLATAAAVVLLVAAVVVVWPAAGTGSGSRRAARGRRTRSSTTPTTLDAARRPPYGGVRRAGPRVRS